MARTTRRTFVKSIAYAGAALPLVHPSLTRAAPANGKANLGGVGVGGKGASDISGIAKGHNIICFADVNQGTPRKKKGGYVAAKNKWPNATGYADWRVMLDKHGKELDGINVSTPDHMHAPITMTAFTLGIGTYTQKPMTHTVHEARQLTLAAAKHKVVTQMGNQHHSGRGYRTLFKLVRDGAIGKIKEGHSWSNRPIWPQGIDRPSKADEIPEGMHWDLWLGVAPERPYNKAYAPFKWRGWYDFGTGALGDMGCHIIDPVYWSCGLTSPKTISYDGPQPKPETFPKQETLTWTFPGTEWTTDGDFKVKWYDGGRKPPAELGHGHKLGSNGCLLVGEKGSIYCSHGSGPELLPKEKFKDYERPRLDALNHYQQFTDALVEKGPAPTSNFSYAGPMTETVLLGVIASRVPGVELKWDPEKFEITNSKKATDYLKITYRKGWEVPGL